MRLILSACALALASVIAPSPVWAGLQPVATILSQSGGGLITNLTMYGTRSFSIYNAAGTRVFDSGAQFEQIIAARNPALFNTDSGLPANLDKRSDSKGPEPEGVAVGEINGRLYAFIAQERAGGVFQYDITDPANAFFVDYLNTTASPRHVSPESVQFIHASSSPTGNPLVLVGYELSSDIQIFEVTPGLGYISQAPAPFAGLAGSAIALTAAASADRPLALQWYRDGVAIPGATGPNFNIGTLQSTNVGNYALVATTPFGSVTNTVPVAIAETAHFAGVALDGPVNARVALQFLDVLGGTNQWQTLTNLNHAGGRQFYLDLNSAAAARRFFRAVPTP